MTNRISPSLLRFVGVMLFGGLAAWRAEVANQWVRALLAGAAFGTLGVLWRLPWRPLRLSVRFFRSKTIPPDRR